MTPEWVWHLNEEEPAPMALGDKIGTDSQRVSRYETGEITPSLYAFVAQNRLKTLADGIS